MVHIIPIKFHKTGFTVLPYEIAAQADIRKHIHAHKHVAIIMRLRICKFMEKRNHCIHSRKDGADI